MKINKTYQQMHLSMFILNICTNTTFNKKFSCINSIIFKKEIAKEEFKISCLAPVLSSKSINDSACPREAAL